MVHSNDPLLSLRMKCAVGLSMNPHNHENARDEVSAMLDQERFYQCGDYLGRRNVRKNEKSGTSVRSVSEENEVLDGVCREKMCEWSYRVCEHFNTNREIVAIAMKFLDRFIDHCSCDRNAFKLAAMTTLYMATKLFNPKQIPIGSLADLSRGEFENSNIAEMELVILKTLDWRLNPPTVLSFINRFHSLLCIEEVSTAKDTHRRATFFAELSVYDYSLVTENASLLAIASLLNAFEGLEDPCFADVLHTNLNELVQCQLSLVVDVLAVEKVQSRLWYLYSCSAQVKADEIIPLRVCQERQQRHEAKIHPSGKDEALMDSPISVNLHERYC
uniref:Cyclin-like domain-containing protein n=1 Tax=Phaeodactylum tricornutum TaxID=2850 RepID=A0A8J9SDR1_PHATR